MIDSHCHLADEAFAADLADVVGRAQSAGLEGVLCILAAGDPNERAQADRLRSLWSAVRFAAGVHPHQAGRPEGRRHNHAEVALGHDHSEVAPGHDHSEVAPGFSPAKLVNLVRQAVADIGACAIGEIGLDYHYDFSPRDIQRRVFGAQVALARELALPVVIHTREADDDTLDVLAREGGGAVRGVFHCFTGDRALARRALDLGFHLSFAGIVTFPKAGALCDVARAVPADRLLVETDSPFLAPVPHRGRRNEPAWVARVIDALAAARGVHAEELARATTENFRALFGYD